MEKLPLSTPSPVCITKRVLYLNKSAKKHPLHAAAFVHPTAQLLGKNTLGKNCYIGAFCVLKNCVIGDNSKVEFCSHLQNCEIGKNCEIYASFLQDFRAKNTCKIQSSTAYGDVSVGSCCKISHSEIYNQISVGHNCNIGAFSHIHDDCTIGDFSRVGNFVELKRTTLNSHSKCAHLAYLGDGEVGANTNIGAGVIFCNYDGKNKHKTRVGDNCFIGSNCTLVAPISVGNDSFVGADSCVVDDIPRGSFFVRRARETKLKGHRDG